MEQQLGSLPPPFRGQRDVVAFRTLFNYIASGFAFKKGKLRSNAEELLSRPADAVLIPKRKLIRTLQFSMQVRGIFSASAALKRLCKPRSFPKAWADATTTQTRGASNKMSWGQFVAYVATEKFRWRRFYMFLPGIAVRSETGKEESVRDVLNFYRPGLKYLFQLYAKQDVGTAGTKNLLFSEISARKDSVSYSDWNMFVTHHDICPNLLTAHQAKDIFVAALDNKHTAKSSSFVAGLGAANVQYRRDRSDAERRKDRASTSKEWDALNFGEFLKCVVRLADAVLGREPYVRYPRTPPPRDRTPLTIAVCGSSLPGTRATT